MVERGATWYEWQELYTSKFYTSVSIAFGEVSTHNHFVFDRGGKMFNRTAPVIKLAANATEDDHLAILGLLNCSLTCFWLKQGAHNKGDSTDDQGSRTTGDVAFNTYAFNSTLIGKLPLPARRPLDLARRIDALARAYTELLPESLRRRAMPDAATLASARSQARRLRGQMIALQEELDWQCYHLYGLADDALTYPNLELAIDLGQRAFEIVLARQIAAGEVETTWFTRHGSTPITEMPSDWPADYRAIVQNRINLIERDKNIGLIEKPEYKRRWNTEPWDEQQDRALRNWLLDRLESYFDLDGRMNEGKQATASADLLAPKLTSVAKISDMARADKDIMQVAEIFAGRMDFDVGALVSELISAESVPALPVLRYKPAAMDKRRAWERTWDLQREEDRINAEIEKREHEWKQAEADGKPTTALREQIANLKSRIPKIPVPPKYTSADFLSGDFWRLRGKLDVPKERWVSFPYCEGEDGTLVIAWAGYDHLQLAKAIAERYELAKDREGRKLVPLLAAIGEQIPWLKQWHNDLDPKFGTRMGDYFEGYLAEEAKALGMSVEQVMAWTPPERTKRGRRGYTMGRSGTASNESET
jgi:hypothetical protein